MFIVAGEFRYKPFAEPAQRRQLAEHVFQELYQIRTAARSSRRATCHDVVLIMSTLLYSWAKESEDESKLSEREVAKKKWAP